MQIRTYAESGRISLKTIKKVAIEHLISGNKIFCIKALKELKSAADTEHQSIMNTINIINDLNNGNHSPDHIKKILIKNNIKYRAK